MDSTIKETIYKNIKLKIKNKIVTIIKTKNYKKKYVIEVKVMSIEKYKIMMINPSEKIYIKTQKKNIKEKILQKN